MEPAEITPFQELKMEGLNRANGQCAQIRLPDGTLIAFGASAAAEQIETILGMLAC